MDECMCERRVGGILFLACVLCGIFSSVAMMAVRTQVSDVWPLVLCTAFGAYLWAIDRAVNGRG